VKGVYNGNGRMKATPSNESGHLIIATLVLIALVLTIATGMIESAMSTSKTRAVVKTQSSQYYEVEKTLNATIGWMQDNSKYFATLFKKANFEANFTLGTPSFGANEGLHFESPTLVKIKGTSNTPMLTTNNFFGTDAFPNTTHITTGVAFNPITSFQSASLGSANARVMMVWARATPEGYEPVFRVDVVTGNNPDRGVHSYSYLYSSLQSTGGSVGFYGQNSVFTNNTKNSCWSNSYTHSTVTNTWSKSADQSNCEVQSDSVMEFGSTINGNAATLATGGMIFSGSSGKVTGTKCDGPGCHSYSLPALNPYDVWSIGKTVVDVNAKSSNKTIAPGYYGTLQIGNNKRITFNGSGKYYIKAVDYQGSQGEMFFPVMSGTNGDGTLKKYELTVDTINNAHLNGNRFYHNTNAPHRIEILYNGSGDFKFNGTAGVNVIFTAPAADVEVLGNHDFYGAIRAKSLKVTGAGKIYYDETGYVPPVLKDILFQVRKATQRYR
jgi:hypothetical protein